MIGRLYNKMRKEMREDQEREIRARLWDASLAHKETRKRLLESDEPVGSTRMVKCACGHKARWDIGSYPVTFKCKKCGGRQTLLK